ncbi:MAG: PKD domain-containing protein, partial [Bacteroidia bacterium]|nr:PKD domain-containing protein [Bacteroidia bacterium]
LVAPSFTPFVSTAGIASGSQNFSVSGSGLNAGVSIKAPLGFQISTQESGNYSDSLFLNAVNTEVFKTIYVRLNSLVAGNYSGNIRIRSTGATDVNFFVTGSVACGPHAGISPGGIGQATFAVFYSQAFSQTGYVSPVWSIPSGTLPTGVSMNSTSGVLSGIPSQLGFFNFTIKVEEGNCFQTINYSLNVTGDTIARFTFMPNSCSDRFVQFFDSSVLASSWFWDFGDGDTSSLQNPSHVYAKDSIYNVLLRINGGGKTSTRSVQVASNPIIPSLVAVPNCNFVYTILGAPKSYGYRYSWSFDPGSSGNGDTIQIPTRSYISAGSKTINLNISAQGKCFAVATPLVFSAQAATVGVNAGLSITAPGNNFCSNNRILTNTSTGSGNIFTYSLDGAPFVPYTGPVALSGLSIGVHNARLAAHDGSCFDTAQVNFTISNVFTSFTSTPSVCNQVVSFNNTSSVAFGSASYNWVFGNPVKGFSTEMSPSFNYGIPGTDTATLTVTASSGCSVSLKQAVTVGSNLGPNPNFTASKASGLCTNKIQFTNQTTNGAGANYTWNFGDGTTANSINATRAYADTGLYTVRLTVTTALCSLWVEKAVKVDSGSFGPSALFRTDTLVQAITNNNFNFYNQSKYLGAGWNAKYYWYYGDGTMDSLFTSKFGKVYANPGNFTVTMVAEANNGCTDQFTRVVSVLPVAKSNFGFIQNSCTNRLVRFIDSSSLVTSYFWEFGDGVTSTLANPQHTYLRDSIYQVRLTINGTLVSTREITVATSPVIGAITSVMDCQNIYTFYGAPSGAGLSYLWTFGSGSFGDNQTNQIPYRGYNVAGPTSVSVMISSYGRCTANSSPYNFNALSVANATKAKLSLVAPNGNLCSSTRIVRNLSNPGLVCSYRLNADNFISIDTAITLTNLQPGFHKILLRATNGLCVSDDSIEFYVGTAMATFSSTPSNCNQVVSFTNLSSTADNGGFSSFWVFGTPSKGTSVDVSPSFNYGTPGTDSATLTVTARSGCTSTLRLPVSVGSGTSNIQPGFTLSNAGGNCSNKFQFTDTTKGGSQLNYIWDFGDGTSSTIQNPVKSYGDAGTFNVALTVFEGNCITTVSKPLVVGLDAFGPSANFSISNPFQTIANNSFNFINSTKNLGPGWVYKAIWRLGDGQVDSNNFSVFNKTYNRADTFTVTLTVFTSTGCEDSISRQVIVAPVPISKFGFVQNTCSSRLVRFIDSTNLATSYFWDFGDGNTSTLAEPTHTYAKDGVYAVKLTINGFLISQKDVGVYTFPSANYTFTSSNCKNVFQFEVADSGSIYRYQWQFSKGLPNALQIPNPRVSFDSTYEFIVQYKVSSGGFCEISALPDTLTSERGVKANILISSSDFCSNNRTISNASVGGTTFYLSIDNDPYTLYTAPVSLTNLSSGQHFISFVAMDSSCADTLNRTFAISDITGNFTSRSGNCNRTVEFFPNLQTSDATEIKYSWNFANEGTDTVPMPLFVFDSPGKKFVTMRVEAESGCVFSFSDSVVANSSAGPISTFNVTEIRTTPCQTGFNFTNTSPDAVQSYWRFGDGQVSDLTVSKTVFHAYLDTGNYQVVMIARNAQGCETVSDTTNIRVVVAGKPSPIASFTLNDTTQCFSFQNFNFLNASTLSGNGWIAKYTWTMSDGTTDTISNSIYGKRFPSLGTFAINLTATSNLGCSHVYSRTVRVVSDTICNPIANGLNPLEMGMFMTVYPNPSEGNFEIKLNREFVGSAQIKVIDILGREVHTESLSKLQLVYPIEMKVMAGQYFVELIDEAGNVLRSSLVIQ